MAYISSFIYCDSIQPEMTPQGIRQQIVNPLQVLKPIALPSNYSFAVSFCVNDFPIDSENTVRVLFESPSKKVVNDTNNLIFKLPVQQNNQDSLSAMQFNLDFRNLVLEESGIYSTIVLFNEERIGEFKISVSEVYKNARS